MTDVERRRSLRVLEVTRSTNDEARSLAAAGAPSGTTVVARQQLAGRGRLGRSWYSPDAGNVYLSYLHRSRRSPAELAGLTLDVASAVASVLGQRGVEARVKWPNDLLLEGRKLGGILCELHLDIEPGRPVVIAGLGLNANVDSFPPELAPTATSLRLATGRRFDELELAAAIADELDRTLARYEERGGPDLRRYHAFFGMLGQRVRFDRPAGGTAHGRAVGVASDGGLRVEVDGTELVIRSGEVLPEEKDDE